MYVHHEGKSPFLVINSSDFSPTLRLASPRGAPPGSAPAPAEINDQLIGGEHPMIYLENIQKAMENHHF